MPLRHPSAFAWLRQDRRPRLQRRIVKLRDWELKMPGPAKSRKRCFVTWVVACLCLYNARIFAGILQPGDIVFADGGLDAVIRLDPTTLATNHIASINFTDATGGIAIGRNGDIYAMRQVLGFGAYAEFIRIDGQTGATNKLSNETFIYTGHRMKLSPDGQSLVVGGEAQNFIRGVFRVDLTTGHQSIITTNFTDSPDYERPWDVAFSPQGNMYVTDFAYDNLLRFNADGSNRQHVSDGGLFQFIGGIDVGADGSIYIADRNYHGIIRVDPLNGTQTSVTTFGLLSNPSDIAVAPDGTLIVADAVADVVVRVDPATGQQTLLHSGTPGPRSPCVFSPPAPAAPALAVARSGNSPVVSWTEPANQWRLQTTETPADINSWNDSDLSIDANGDQRSVIIQPNLAAFYFRLRKL